MPFDTIQSIPSQCENNIGLVTTFDPGTMHDCASNLSMSGVRVRAGVVNVRDATDCDAVLLHVVVPANRIVVVAIDRKSVVVVDVARRDVVRIVNAFVVLLLLLQRRRLHRIPNVPLCSCVAVTMSRCCRWWSATLAIEDSWVAAG